MGGLVVYGAFTIGEEIEREQNKKPFFKSAFDHQVGMIDTDKLRADIIKANEENPILNIDYETLEGKVIYTYKDYKKICDAGDVQTYSGCLTIPNPKVETRDTIDNTEVIIDEDEIEVTMYERYDDNGEDRWTTNVSNINIYFHRSII